MLFGGLRGKVLTPSSSIETKSAQIERAMGLPPYAIGRPYNPNPMAADFGRLLRDRYERVTWVFAAVRARANDSSRLKIIVRRDDPDDGPEIDHPLLRLLNYKANVFESAAFFRHRLSAQFDLSAKGAFVELERANSGAVLSCTLLPPQNVSPVPDPVAFVSKYVVKVGPKSYDVKPANMLWFRNPHPLDPYRSMTPLEAAGIAIDTDVLAALYNATFMKNDGRPGGIVGVKGPGMVGEDADELRSYFKGTERVGEWRVIEADGIDVADLATNPREAGWLEARSASKTEILSAFQASPTIVGDTAGRTFDNADADREVYWQNGQIPHCSNMGDVWDLVDDDPNTFVVHDMSKVPWLQRSVLAERAADGVDVQEGRMSIDDYRERRGWKPYNVPATRALLVSMAVTPLDGTEGDETGGGTPTSPAAEPSSGGGAAAADTTTTASADSTGLEQKDKAAASGGNPLAATI